MWQGTIDQDVFYGALKTEALTNRPERQHILSKALSTARPTLADLRKSTNLGTCVAKGSNGTEMQSPASRDMYRL